MKIPAPTADYVRRRLPRGREQDPYYDADRALRPVFQQWPMNRDRGEVLAKVALLNALYATRIMDVYPVVNHILKLDIDARLRRGDLTLVGDVARMRVGGKEQSRLSFASKYCAWHQPEKFQIFDKNVAWMLCEYRRQFGFAEVVWTKLRDYGYFMRAVDALREHFGLEGFSRKEIDKFLWLKAARIWKRRRAAAG